MDCMKKFLFLLLLCFCCLFPGGCGKQEASASPEGLGDTNETKEYYDIMVENTAFPELDRTGQALYFLGMQFYRGEAVQLWGQLTFDAAWGVNGGEIFRYKMDGSRETATVNVPSDYLVSFTHGFQDSEGNFYFWGKRRKSLDEPNPVVILDPSGEELYRTGSDGKDEFLLFNICQTLDGSVYWLLDDGYGTTKLAKSRPGALPEEMWDVKQWYGGGSISYYGATCLGLKGDAVCLGRDDGFWQVDLEEESLLELLQFLGTSYNNWDGESWAQKREQQSFRVLEDGSVETLRCCSDGTGATIQRLYMSRVERIPIVIRAESFYPWAVNRVNRFNQENDTYYVVLEDFYRTGQKWASYDSDFEDFVRKTSIEIAAGKGPDIFMGSSIFGDAVISLIEKGAFADLAPFMEADGIREEDYFPVAFCRREGDGIYGISAIGDFTVYKTDPRLLGGEEPSDIETLADALLAWPEEAAYMEYVDSAGLLRLFLEGSEDLWGMVDWEEGACDFSGGLFGKLLEAAGRFGYESGKNNSLLAFRWGIQDIYDNQPGNEVVSGVLFDDGLHGAVSSYSIFSVNSNSANQEGAWEFLRFLLGEEMQSAARVFSSPVLKSAFKEWIRKDLEMDGRGEWDGPYTIIQDGEISFEIRTFQERDFTESVINEYIDAMENARLLPVRTEPLLDIICEEAAYYFNGSKGVEETAEVIQNRVQLYLNEHK
jgi:hypothetical protein|nr:extracellular solute-binding protein [uncultured Acetatifactor sp.]